jgi:predicted Zn-dependent protease
LKIALAQSLLETREMPQVDEAITLLKSALQAERDNSFAWYLLSTAHGQKGNDALAKYASAERFYAVGDIQRARSFAQRAQEDLPRNGPQWRRASDIIVVADAQLAKTRSRRRGPKPFTVTTGSQERRNYR